MSRRAVFAIAAAGFAAFVGLYATQPLLPLFEAVFGLSKAQAGLTVSASTLAVAAMAPVVGAWADRVARKRAIVAGGCLLCVCVLACAGASGYRALLLWRFLQGLAVPVMYVPALAYVSEEAGEAGVGRAMASYVTGNVLGGFTGRTVSGLVAEAFDWRASFVAL
ncbi:MAG TPA: MFS transporter, partial [Myxococcota bacterium]|nr:MFS transporter [Myxococcota bacterium]